MRLDPDPSGPERTQLAAFLDFQRETVLLKTEGLDRAQLGRRLGSSTMTLAGLLNHLALVEDSWLRDRFAGLGEDPLWDGVDWDADPDHEWRTALELEPDELHRRYREACDRSREVVAAAADLDQPSASTDREGRHFDLRWILLHLIEETARHAGHADLIRESIDGVTGE